MDSKVIYDIVIIGAGMAGLTAGIYAGRASKKTLILEGSTYGGQIINTPDVQNYPSESHISGAGLMSKVYAQAKDCGAEIEFETVEKIQKNDDGTFNIHTNGDDYQARTIIIASGTRNRQMNLPREQELMGHGISFCATCDGSLYRDAAVAVYGGGNSAISEASYLTSIAKKVYLIHRRDELRASGVAVEDFMACHNSELILSSTITELNGQDKLESIVLNTPHGRRELQVSALFIAIGREASVDYVDGIEKDPDGYIVAGEDCATNIPGIFVAGDIRTKSTRQLVTAASDGAVAVNSALAYMRNNV